VAHWNLVSCEEQQQQQLWRAIQAVLQEKLSTAQCRDIPGAAVRADAVVLWQQL
jgi:hypothetical protein